MRSTCCYKLTLNKSIPSRSDPKLDPILVPLVDSPAEQKPQTGTGQSETRAMPINPSRIIPRPLRLRMVRALAVVVAVIMYAAPANAAKTPLPSFRSPSGNIRCFDAVALHCNIARADYTTTLQNRCIAGASVDSRGLELSRR